MSSVNRRVRFGRVLIRWPSVSTVEVSLALTLLVRTLSAFRRARGQRCRNRTRLISPGPGNLMIGVERSDDEVIAASIELQFQAADVTAIVITQFRTRLKAVMPNLGLTRW